MRGGRAELKDRFHERSSDQQHRRHAHHDDSSQFEPTENKKYSRTYQKPKSKPDWRPDESYRLEERGLEDHVGPKLDTTSKVLKNKPKLLQDLIVVEEAYRELLEKTLPEVFFCLLQHPILFTETINAVFIIVNDFLDDRIRSMLHSLGETLGIPENKHVLLHILLNFPNNLGSLHDDIMDQLCYAIREELNNISIRRRALLTKTKAKIPTRST